MATTPGGPPLPFDPTNTNDPRYDPRSDPRNDPRWQREQRKNWERAQRAQADNYRAQAKAARRAQATAFRSQAEANRQQWRMYNRANRRSSLIGPLLLIAFGVIFLLVRFGHIGFLPFLAWYGQWWPLLLIGIGLLRLAEWALDRARAQNFAAPVRYTVGGGVVTAVIFLTIAGVSVRGAENNGSFGRNGQVGHFGFTGDDLQQFLGSRHEEDSPSTTHAISPTGALLIENPRGEVTLAGTSDDGLLHLSIHKEVFSSSDNEAASRLQTLNPAFSGPDDNLLMRVPAMEGGTADLRVLVPAGVRVSVNSNHGDLHITNLKAPVSVTANNGEVELAAISADVSAHVNHRGRSLNVRSINGKVDAQGSGDEVNLSDIAGAVHVGGDFFGGGHLQHISGPVDYHTGRIHFTLARLDGEVDMDENDSFSASEVVGPMVVETHSRNLTLTKVAGDLHVTNNHGDVDVVSVPPSGSVTIENHNGAVTLTMPEKAKFTVTAETNDGDASSDFGGLEQNHGSVRGTINGGGPVVKLTTSHGDISVRRNAEGPLPPPPAVAKITGFGTVPAGAPLDGDSTADDVREASEDARRTAKDAKVAAQQAVTEANAAAREAMNDAREKQKEAARLAREAAKQKD